jgi:hypothetical protein
MEDASEAAPLTAGVTRFLDRLDSVPLALRERRFENMSWKGEQGGAPVRKTVVDTAAVRQEPRSEQGWLDLAEVARVEVTSEDPNFPIEAALIGEKKPGWRAAQKGLQTIRIIFDQPTRLRRIRLEFSETETTRTQEFTLRWSTAPSGPFSEIVRQQWNFSPQGSTTEIEDYQVNLEGVRVLELVLKPDLTPANAYATLDKWRMA